MHNSIIHNPAGRQAVTRLAAVWSDYALRSGYEVTLPVARCQGLITRK